LADNLIAPAAGSSLATDDIGGVHYPRAKLVWGADGVAVDASAANPVPVAPAATEVYVGKHGGDVISAAQIPTTAAGAYASGDVIGTKMTFPNMTRLAAGPGIVQSLLLQSKVALTGAVDVLLFSADPSASTFTDNAALNLNVGDFDKLIGVVSLSSWVALGTPSIAQAHTVGIAFDLPAGQSIYAVLVARSAPTLASATDLKLVLNVIPG
jgi:hypothetical protein